MSWILGPTPEQRAAQEAQLTALMVEKHEEWKQKADAKDAWLKASTCPHCGQHPPTPPWFY